LEGGKRLVLEGIKQTLHGGLVRYAEAVVLQRFTVQSTEIFVSGAIAIVWQYTYVDFIVLGHASSILETIIRTRVGLIGNR
jgi:hypothetical protein